MLGEVGKWNGFEWAYFRGPFGHIFAVKRTPSAGWESRAWGFRASLPLASSLRSGLPTTRQGRNLIDRIPPLVSHDQCPSGSATRHRRRIGRRRRPEAATAGPPLPRSVSFDHLDRDAVEVAEASVARTIVGQPAISGECRLTGDEPQALHVHARRSFDHQVLRRHVEGALDH